MGYDEYNSRKLWTSITQRGGLYKYRQAEGRKMRSVPWKLIDNRFIIQYILSQQWHHYFLVVYMCSLDHTAREFRDLVIINFTPSLVGGVSLITFISWWFISILLKRSLHGWQSLHPKSWGVTRRLSMNMCITAFTELNPFEHLFEPIIFWRIE